MRLLSLTAKIRPKKKQFSSKFTPSTDAGEAMTRLAVLWPALEKVGLSRGPRSRWADGGLSQVQQGSGV